MRRSRAPLRRTLVRPFLGDVAGRNVVVENRESGLFDSADDQLDIVAIRHPTVSGNIHFVILLL